MLSIGMSSSACVVAIPAEFQQEVDGDGGVNAYPVIKASTPAMPGPITVGSAVQNISLTLSDSDLRDTLYVRVFRDYSLSSTGYFDDMTIPNDRENGREDRQSQQPATTSGWCQGLTGSHVFDVVVADRPFDPSPNALLPNRSTTGNGKTSTRSWVVQCVTTP